MNDNEVRLIDANALCEEFKKRHRAALRWKEKAILADDEEIKIRADAVLTFLSEVKLTIDNAPTADDWENYSTKLWKEAYEQGKADRPTGVWIPVSDRLPQNYILCLFCDIDGDIYYGHHTSENRWYAEYLDDKIKNVIAWQPLPEPYKKGGETNDE